MDLNQKLSSTCANVLRGLRPLTRVSGFTIKPRRLNA